MLAAIVQCTKRVGGMPTEEQVAWQTALASKVGDLKPIDIAQVHRCCCALARWKGPLQQSIRVPINTPVNAGVAKCACELRGQLRSKAGRQRAIGGVRAGLAAALLVPSAQRTPIPTLDPVPRSGPQAAQSALEQYMLEQAALPRLLAQRDSRQP